MVKRWSKEVYLKTKITEDFIIIICELKDIEISNKSISMSVAIHQRTLYRWLSMPLTLSHCMPNEEYKMKAYDKQKVLYTICCPILAKPSALNGCNLAFEIRAF